MSKFAEYYRALSAKQRDAFCKRACLSRRYVEIHLTGPNGPRKGASVVVMKSIAKASRGALTEVEIFSHFADAA